MAKKKEPLIEPIVEPKWKRELRQEGLMMQVIRRLNKVIEYINADRTKRETK